MRFTHNLYFTHEAVSFRAVQGTSGGAKRVRVRRMAQSRLACRVKVFMVTVAVFLAQHRQKSVHHQSYAFETDPCKNTSVGIQGA